MKTNSGATSGEDGFDAQNPCEKARCGGIDWEPWTGEAQPASLATSKLVRNPVSIKKPKT